MWFQPYFLVSLNAHAPFPFSVIWLLFSCMLSASGIVVFPMQKNIFSSQFGLNLIWFPLFVPSAITICSLSNV